MTEALKIAVRAGVRTVLNPAPARLCRSHILIWWNFGPPTRRRRNFSLAAHKMVRRRRCGAALQAECLRSKGARNVIITLGEHGCFYSGAEGEALVPPYPVNAVDSTAAGDSFNAAFCVALAEGRPLPEALLRGNAAEP